MGVDKFARMQNAANTAQLVETTPSLSKRFRQMLKQAKEPIPILVQGDSTGNGPEEWVYGLGLYLQSKYPQYSAYQRLWDTTLQRYGNKRSMAFGTNGDAYALLDGTHTISCPDSVANRITGDIEIVMKLAMNDFTPSATKILASKFSSAGNRGWVLGINTAGKLFWWWSTDGTALSGGEFSAILSSQSIPEAVDGFDIWIKATLDVDNGSSGATAKYYYSTSGNYWTQIGDDRILAGASSIYASTATIEIGGRGGTVDVWPGKVYNFSVKSGIDGGAVASFDAGFCFPSSQTTTKDLEGNTWTRGSGVTWGYGSPAIVLINASAAGQAIAYSADATRFALQTPVEPVLSFISYGHNEGSTTSYQTTYASFVAQIIAKYPYTGVVAISQNPRVFPADYISEHAMRCQQICSVANKTCIGLIDVTSGFLSGDLSILISTDGIHPSDPYGNSLWLNLVKTYLGV